MECPKCKSKVVAKRKCLRKLKYIKDRGIIHQEAYRIKEYVCCECWHEFDVI